MAVQIGNTIFEMSTENRRKTTYFLNKNEITFAQIPSTIEGYAVNKAAWNDALGQANGAWVTITMETGDVVELKSWKGMGDLGFLRFTSRFADSVGMMGNYSTGVLTYRNGTVVPTMDTYHSGWLQYGSTWRVQPNEPNLFRSPGASSCTPPPPGGRSWLDEGQARQACVNQQVKTANLELCVWDVYLVGDPEVAKIWKARN
jgi:hypothetical protein